MVRQKAYNCGLPLNYFGKNFQHFHKIDKLVDIFICQVFFLPMNNDCNKTFFHLVFINIGIH